MSARQEDEDELPTLEGGEHVFSDEERISISNPFRRQDLQEIVVVDRAVRVEDVFAGHLAPVVEDVDFFSWARAAFLAGAAIITGRRAGLRPRSKIPFTRACIGPCMRCPPR